jgi:hypothetical protein
MIEVSDLIKALTMAVQNDMRAIPLFGSQRPLCWRHPKEECVPECVFGMANTDCLRDTPLAQRPPAAKVVKGKKKP